MAWKYLQRLHTVAISQPPTSTAVYAHFNTYIVPVSLSGYLQTYFRLHKGVQVPERELLLFESDGSLASLEEPLQAHEVPQEPWEP